MRILGIWDGHDSGAALLVDGRLVAAVNEERLSRRKLEVRFPAASISACLELGSLRPDEVEVVAASTSDVAKAIGRLLPSSKEAYYQLRRRKTPPGPLTSLRKWTKYWITEFAPNPLSRLVSRACLRQDLARLGLSRARLQIHDHHRCHAMAAACGSGYERAIVVTLDGVGDGLSATVNLLEDGRLRLLEETSSHHSAGIFFEHVTNLLNMRELEDEGKVMALASYAAQPETNPLATLLRAQGLRLHTAVAGHALRRCLQRVQWSFPNEQFARMAQETLEEATVALVREAVRLTGASKVALAGGVASNIMATRRVRLLPEVEDVFVFPHMGDGGLALGAALSTASEGEARLAIDLQSLALGPGFGENEIRAQLDAERLTYDRPSDLSETVADLLVRECVVLWFEGRMEYGPRALGQRSILARPDVPALRERLNLVLKKRVWYQPFCPSLLESDAQRSFSDWKGTPNRHMTMAYTVREDSRGALAGVISRDGTCRPQIVSDDARGGFPALLRAMKKRVGLGAVLNTSLNFHGDPLVCTPEQAIAVFRASGAEALAIGPFLVEALPCAK